MDRVSQSPTDPAFVQDPYPFYRRAREAGGLVWWEDYGMPVALSNALVSMIFRDRRFGREVPPEMARDVPEHLQAFYGVEAHSMLELEAPRHKRLRALVLRAFTSRRIATMGPEIETLCNELLDAVPKGPFDLLPVFANRVPVIVIARLLGVPESMADQLLAWSNDMVAMYQARRDRTVEDAAETAAREFSDFLRGYVETRRSKPADDLITHLISAEEDGEKLSTDELITTCILLLNAGHEATVHSMGNGVKTLLEQGLGQEVLGPDMIVGTVEEILRFDPPLHMFTRYAYEEIEVGRNTFRRGEEVGLMLAAANRDPGVWEDPDKFNPRRPVVTNQAFGGGVHFCVGAPLARLEMQIALPILFERMPGLHLTEPPHYADVYHFHGLKRLMVNR